MLLLCEVVKDMLLEGNLTGTVFGEFGKVDTLKLELLDMLLDDPGPITCWTQ
jgi:hypothetical protein